MVSEVQRYKLKNFIKELASYKARHTEFVSVYIPTGYDLNKIINHLAQEQGTATNIKSAITRKNVIDALERMIQHLRLFKKTPENGLAVFAGNVASQEGKSDVRVWSIEPPEKLKMRLYRCDKEFVLDVLERMLEAKEIYGLVVMDRREATIAFLRGKSIDNIGHLKSNVPGKFKAGGQSAQRFARSREGEAKDFYKKIADILTTNFYGNKKLKGIIVGGPGPTKEEFVDGDFLNEELKNKIIAVKDVTYTDQFGLQELLTKSEDVLAKEEIMAEKKLMNQFLEKLAKEPELVVYGKSEVLEKIQLGAVEMILVSEELADQEIEEAEAKAKQFGTEVHIISTETKEGVQLKELGGMGAILRYKI